ncbi:iron-containing alcohol dehydrogenase [Candidatus Aerophobetes bacterium]|uniref:Iron-containing alcohol dehydrogenase n=1 Tax=Aerophobetes bacterium TaxID=2030807 RepID=A0A523S678_UNCAE|nr:MAG: iron-containing alcohol dehydrogenase [Candidatus Aerophobetes bacterium]
MREFEFYLPTRVLFGKGVVENIGKETAKLGKSALIVTGQASARKTGLLKRVGDSLKKSRVKTTLFEGVEANPSLETIKKGTKLAKEKECEVIIGLGGGSPMDAAKAIAVLTTNPAPLTNYFGRNKVKEAPLPIIAVPTTAGTGSEINPYAALTNTDKAPPRKEILIDLSIFPKVALVDPELTLSLPASVTAETGIDAFSHALESYLSNRSRPLSEALASEAIRLLVCYLPKVMKNLKDINARSYTLYASLLAGIAIAQSGTILVHGMSYRLTTDLGLSHGKACAILLPVVSEFNLSQGHPKLISLSRCLGESTEDLTTKEIVKKVITRIENLITELSLPQNLKTRKVGKELIAEFAQEVMRNKAKLTNNPRSVTLNDVIEMYEKALWGEE